jgi:hypothetical protein
LATKKKEGRKVGKFFPCPANGDTHPEQVACEVKETVDAKGKTRHSFFCPICNTRTFLNNWEPEHSFRTIVWAEAQGLHPMGKRRLQATRARTRTRSSRRHPLGTGRLRARKRNERARAL